MGSRPYTGKTTDGYGPRVPPIPGASSFHQGIDGIGGYNTAPESGVLVWYGYSGGWGNLIKFQGDSGTLHYLAHNAPNGLLVPVGSRHPEKANLGVKGMTGTATGVHVHWETRPGGGATIDPEIWLSKTSTAGGGSSPIVLKKFAEKESNMLIMNRTQDNVIAVFGEDEQGPYWQEIHYLASAPSGSALEVTTRFVIGLSHSVPVVDYDNTGWDYRSNRNPQFKRDVFDLDPKTGVLTWKAKPVTGGGGAVALTDADIARIAKAVLDGSAARLAS